MKQEFSEIEVGSRLLLNLSSGNKSMEMGATIVRHLKDNIALISLDNSSGQVLKFDNIFKRKEHSNTRFEHSYVLFFIFTAQAVNKTFKHRSYCCYSNHFHHKANSLTEIC